MKRPFGTRGRSNFSYLLPIIKGDNPLIVLGISNTGKYTFIGDENHKDESINDCISRVFSSCFGGEINQSLIKQENTFNINYLRDHNSHVTSYMMTVDGCAGMLERFFEFSMLHPYIATVAPFPVQYKTLCNIIQSQCISNLDVQLVESLNAEGMIDARTYAHLKLQIKIKKSKRDV